MRACGSGAWSCRAGTRAQCSRTLSKSKRSRTVPLVADLVPIIDKWSEGKASGSWLFSAPRGGPLSEPNWKRSVGWSAAVRKIGRPTLRVHDLRHTCASLWLGAGADPKVVQRILGHASAAMTMDLYGHLIDHNLWDSARRVGGILGHLSRRAHRTPAPVRAGRGSDLGCCVERMTRFELATSTLGRSRSTN